MAKENRVLEVVLFKLNEGVDRDAFMEAIAESEVVARKQPGYVSRQLLESEDNQWVDLVWWESLDEAKTAAEVVMQDPGFAAFGSMIAQDSVTFLHAMPVSIKQLG